jgi:L-fuculose-phosphate aldolase
MDGMKEQDARQDIVTQCRAIGSLGLNQGAVGSISLRVRDYLLVTPANVPLAEVEPRMIAVMPIAGEYGAWQGPMKPTSEWRMHLDIARARSDINAIVHTDALYATILACLRKPIPAIHYMIALFGGADIRCTNYAAFGTKQLAEFALEGLKDRQGVLLANHGMVATGATLRQAMWRAAELETLARTYHHALSAGKPFVLSAAAVHEIVERFKVLGYHAAEQAKTVPPAAKAEAKTAPKKIAKKNKVVRRQGPSANKPKNDKKIAKRR